MSRDISDKIEKLNQLLCEHDIRPLHNKMMIRRNSVYMSVALNRIIQNILVMHTAAGSKNLYLQAIKRRVPEFNRVLISNDVSKFNYFLTYLEAEFSTIKLVQPTNDKAWKDFVVNKIHFIVTQLFGFDEIEYASSKDELYERLEKERKNQVVLAILKKVDWRNLSVGNFLKFDIEKLVEAENVNVILERYHAILKNINEELIQKIFSAGSHNFLASAAMFFFKKITNDDTEKYILESLEFALENAFTTLHLFLEEAKAEQRRITAPVSTPKKIDDIGVFYSHVMHQFAEIVQAIYLEKIIFFEEKIHFCKTLRENSGVDFLKTAFFDNDGYAKWPIEIMDDIKLAADYVKAWKDLFRVLMSLETTMKGYVDLPNFDMSSVFQDVSLPGNPEELLVIFNKISIRLENEIKKSPEERELLTILIGQCVNSIDGSDSIQRISPGFS